MLRYPTLHLLFICLIVWLWPGSVRAQPVILSDTQERLSTLPFVSLLADPSGTLTARQVSSPEYANRFLAAPPEQFNNLLRATPTQVWWMRIEIHQTSNNVRYLVTEPAGLSRLDAFIVNHDSPHIQSRGNLEEGHRWQRLPTLKLPRERATIYLRANDNMRELWRYLNLQLLSDDALYKRTAHDYLIYGGMMMSLLVLTSYNLILFFSLRNRSYLALVLILLSLALVQQRMYNIIPGLPCINKPDSLWFTGSIHLLLISLMQFGRQLLDTKKLMPVTDRILLFLMLITAVSLPIIHSHPDTEKWSFSLIVLTSLIGSTIGGIAILRGSRVAWSILPGAAILPCSAAPVTLWHLDLIETLNPLLLNDIFAFGSLANAVLLSLTLAEHTRQIRLKAEQAATENRVKDEFLTTMSHELRTPINSVVATAELLKHSQLPVQEKEYIARLETASRHMLGLVNDILDLSRMGQATITLNNEAFHLATLLDQLNKMLQAEATKKGLLLSLRATTDLNRHFNGDAQRLTQVLLNLLGNAIKFTEQGSVTLHIREASTAGNGNIHLHFEVADTGIGIAPKDQVRLFKPFTQVDNKRTRHHGGSGMGLAISHKLVETMGGKLELDSTPGEGSRFFFTLMFPIQTNSPVGTSLAGDVSGASLTEATITDKRILLVDDDEMNRFFGSELLNKLGADTTVIASGEEAILLIRQQSFDLIFMDVSMPGMDGYETTKLIRTDPHFSDLPIIALTAHAIAGEKERCLSAGMNDYLTKPIDPLALRQSLTHWIR